MAASSITVRTGSRLHLGLLSVPGESSAPLRQFGGLGLMIDQPDVRVEATSAAAWSNAGPSSERALEFARHVVNAIPEAQRRPLAIRVHECPEAHSGLGTGTQLALATGQAAWKALGQPTIDAVTMAGIVGRGLRSGLGVHGFQRGGFLVDGGKGPGTAVAPLLSRHEFPEDWHILLITPRQPTGLAGVRERDAFARLAHEPQDHQQTESLCRLALLGILPSLVEHDLDGFSEAVFEFNRRAGLLFQGCQQGAYSSPLAAAMVEWLRGNGVRGVGQSSWGPTLFAFGLPDPLTFAAAGFQRHFGDDVRDMRQTTGRNRGWQE